MVEDIAFSYYCVTNMDRAIQFYEKTLGLSVLFKGEDWSEFQIHGRRIALYKTNEPIMSRGGAVISLMAKPIENIVAGLKSQGVYFVKELQVFPYGKLAEFLDSEGNVLGLYEPPPKD
jgi:predicted enzyme related to lactoylglutathione lyase